MGLAAPERVAALYAEVGLLPMGTRTRGREALRERVERHFRVDSIVSRPAALRVADSAEYQRFHAATFGTYFAPLVPATRLEEFFVRLGRNAERRMQADGQVSEIPVSVWRCRARRARHNLMRNRSAARLKIGTGNCTRWHPQSLRMNRPCPTRVRHVFDSSPCSARSAWPALASPASRRQRRSAPPAAPRSSASTSRPANWPRCC